MDNKDTRFPSTEVYLNKLEFKQKLESLKEHIHIYYSPELKKYLKRFHTIPYVAKGVNETSGSTF
ncbi:hypothetical protein PMEGAPR185_00610 [Priestia megaterium]